MTRRELTLQTLVKVTGQPRGHLEVVIDRWAELQEGFALWNQQVPADELRELEAAFEAEGSGILSWYVRLLRSDASLREDLVQRQQKEKAAKSRRQ